jgi:phospholipase/carboxylesterase
MARTNARREYIGSLECIKIDGSEDGATVVLFHGFGADMNDLASLAQVIEVPEGTNWIFPNGHLTVPLGGHYEGRAWFPVSISELERSSASGKPLDWGARIPPGLEEARALAIELINELDVPMEKLVLGGFSQGGMLATDVTLHLDQPPAGLAVLSGTLVNAEEWTKLAPKHKGMAFFQSHGVSDNVLNFDMAVRLEKLLLDAGWKGQLQRFPGAHEIPMAVISSLGAYIRRRLK